jgi:CheY-like chemotaxis protein
VAKILVADDNSNIQKMVGLALKDQGIDVVAVGNGEAAVRKISDVRPDLVLADVFMPVRNGYEVCQYVKMDPSLAHIPVILLVGAFDPLDEQEAQRVGADGVLKKPFVPPDPLISMVKSALQRAGVSIGGAKAPEPEPVKGTDLLTPSIPVMASQPVPAVSFEPQIAPLDQQSFVDEGPARPAPVSIDSASQTVAFGSLLETPTEDKEEDDAAFLPPPSSGFADRTWGSSDDEEVEEEEEEEKPASWRREDSVSESYAETKPASGSGGAKDWRSGGFEQISAKKTAPSWEPDEAKPEFVETAAASNLTSAAPAAPVAAPEATPFSSKLSTTPFVTDGWTETTSPATQEKSSSKTATAVEEAAHAKDPEPLAPEPVVASAPAPSGPAPEIKAPAKDSWFSVPSNPWNAETEKANKLASAWDAAISPIAPAASSNGAEKAAESFSESTEKVIEQAALPEAAVEALREEAAQVAEDATHFSEEHPAEGTSFYAPEALVETPAAAAAAPTPAPAPSMDDLVAKVLSKMSPEILQAVTREILKPVVEAMVKEELNSKKS